MKNVFIDSQIWLSLYDFSSDDLEQFSKLNDLVNKDVKIFITRQVVDEVKRNRENKIKEALSQFTKINIQIPNLCKGYKEYKIFKDSVKDMQSAQRDLLNKVENDIESENLHADTVINNIYNKLSIIERSDDIINKAILRYNIGNPPGKDKSYGDSINWLTLMTEIPKREDLFFISGDKDFRSAVNDNRINKFLYNEWKKYKSSEIYLYKSLTDFFNLHLKDIKLKTENLKNNLIEQLRKSSSFAETHSVIAELNKYASWTDDQAIALIKAAGSNNQVSGIIEDLDIKEFYTALLQDRIDKMRKTDEFMWIAKKIDLKVSVKDEDEDDDSDIPF